MSNFGQQLRQIRQQKGYGLNEFAKELGVSPAYLSNLETGKTQTIQLDILSKLQEQLHLSVNENVPVDDQFTFRLDRLKGLLAELHCSNPCAAEYLIAMVEQGIDVMNPAESSGI
ncbi:helix-turn-helix domain-containing protein [Paenibacillus sp. JDR-2]|uniref:helix-turn-helix domain-containing protein n=1 Tax=Paenibacillus sp. (strain JDR-2) TaxID=324057 RepID=UPI0001668D3B|nr:helix-turn-helix transcriptional regulator [Paenibacillus sp. JDR-2]ACT03366.1 transcriptional regulator, XRE family [Paenibacillus sp. JDR-2]